MLLILFGVKFNISYFILVVYIHSIAFKKTDILDQKQKGSDKRNIGVSDESGNAQYDLISLFLKHDKNLPREELKDIALNFIVQFSCFFAKIS